jgi:hypothetical protein
VRTGFTGVGLDVSEDSLALLARHTAEGSGAAAKESAQSAKTAGEPGKLRELGELREPGGRGRGRGRRPAATAAGRNVHQLALAGFDRHQRLGNGAERRNEHLGSGLADDYRATHGVGLGQQPLDCRNLGVNSRSGCSKSLEDLVLRGRYINAADNDANHLRLLAAEGSQSLGRRLESNENGLERRRCQCDVPAARLLYRRLQQSQSGVYFSPGRNNGLQNLFLQNHDGGLIHPK